MSTLDDLTPATVHLLATGEIERRWGPPGTGKSTSLRATIRDLVAEHGPESVVVTSFTVTAARSLAHHEESEAPLPLPERAIGTLHSLAFRAIGHPDVALDPKVLKDWNTRVGYEWRITADGRRGHPDTAEHGGGGNSGDELLSAYDMGRSRLIPLDAMPADVRAFAREWDAWKREAGAVDYCLDQESEVLTARGWRRGNDLCEGDLVRSINPETGLAEWQPVQSVYRRRGGSPMIHMVNAVHDSMTTPDHRWLVNRRDSQENWSRQWTTTAELNSTARIPRAAISGDAPTEAKYTDAFVELVAWWFTEGSLSNAGRWRGGQIGQSHRVNPTYCARIEATLRLLAGAPGLRRNGAVVWSVSRSEKRGMTFYCLGGDLVDALDAAAPNKVPTVEFLAQLTTAQLRMFVDTAMDADGHRSVNGWIFCQVDRHRTEAFALAAILAGMSVTFAERRMRDVAMWSVTVSSRRLHATVPGTLRSGHNKGTRTLVDYEGLIWCPTVARYHNFLARRNGKTYYTGNTDMITQALERARDGEHAPGNPAVLISDEAQDMTAVEIALMLAWGAPRTIFALDDDQAINEWRGGDATPLLSLGVGLDGEQQAGVDVTDTLLSQSYRIPAALHTIAQTWIEQCSIRRDKEYRPRDVDGQAYAVRYPIEHPATAAAIERDVQAGRSVMVVASCEYMLRQLVANLRRLGVPFANRYRPAEARWNPLGSSSGMTTAERLYRYLVCDERLLAERSRLWTGDDVRAWLALIGTKEAGLVRGAKTKSSVLPSGPLDVAQVMALFTDENTFYDASEPSLDWLLNAARGLSGMVGNGDRPGKLDYPAAVTRAHGPGALVDEPPVTVGTIHCSPPDEPVLTTEGYVPIGDLEPGHHALLGYDTVGGLRRSDRGAARNFLRAVKPYDGPLLTITTAGSRTRVTPDHRVRVAFTDNFFEKWIVYLMRRGAWWRVGLAVSGHRPYRSGGVAGRLATEQADGGWILGVYETKREALVAEAIIQGRYGIPGTTFEAASGRMTSSVDLRAIHEAVAAEVAPRAKELLSAYGLDEFVPFYSRANQKINRGPTERNKRCTFLTEARNISLLSDYVAVPVVQPELLRTASKDRLALLPATITVTHYSGDVHSLEFPPTHHYVSGGAVVHNSVKGAQADVVYLSPSLSPAGHGEWTRNARSRDSVRRLMYVGLTRAAQSCIVLGSSERSVPQHLLCPPEMSVR